MRLGTMILFLLLTPLSIAQDQPPPDGSPDERTVWRVIVKPTPPFVIETETGPTGIAVELWGQIAERIGVTSTFESREMPELLSGIALGEGDVGVGAISVTPERERELDFSHPYFVSGLAIAVPEEGGSPWLGMLRRMFSITFLQAVAALLLLLLIVGSLVWAFERRKNSETFDERPMRGLGDGLWFSAVTMTTVGYGDKAPRTIPGKLITLVWMFASIIVISSFTAAIASSLTVSSLDSAIGGVEDLPGNTVATVGGTTSEEFLRARGIKRKLAESPREALELVANGEADAAVYDRPILEYLIGRENLASLRVLPGSFEEQLYAFCLPPDAPRREEVNRALLEITGESGWGAIVDRYLGR